MLSNLAKRNDQIGILVDTKLQTYEYIQHNNNKYDLCIYKDKP